MDPINFEPSWPPPPPPPTMGNGPVAHIDLTVRTWSTVDQEPDRDQEDVVDVGWRNAVTINQTSHRYDLAVQSRQAIGGGRPRHVTVYVIQLVSNRDCISPNDASAIW